MPPPLHVAFAGGATGAWRVERIDALIGAGQPMAARIAVHEGTPAPVAEWVLRGVTSNSRYTERPEVDALTARQQGLSRPQARHAALIPIRKTEAWWALAQDERRAIFEAKSNQIAIGMDYLPGVARRLHHSRELGEPFDFLTWFEYAPTSRNSTRCCSACARPANEILLIAKWISGWSASMTRAETFRSES